MKINRVSKKLLKPCTPTPQHLNKYVVSFIDEISPTMNMGFLLFYSSKPINVVSQLQESLAKILVQFYPLAGRYVEKDRLVDCSDQGAEFIQAEAVDVELIDVVGSKTTDQLNDLLPRPTDQVDAAAVTNPLLSIQVTELRCGGLVIGISISHKIFDGSSSGTFIAAWSKACINPEGKSTSIPTFHIPPLLPCKNLNLGSESDPEAPSSRSRMIVVKRFLFEKEAIMSLKSKLKPNDGKGVISRVRAVCAVIAKALIGVDLVKCGQPRPCVIIQSVNMRARTIPPLPKHSCGNLAPQSLSRCIAATEAKEITLQDLVHVIGDAIDRTIADCAEILSQGEEDRCNLILAPWRAYLKAKLEHGDQLNVIWFTDTSKFGFYEADFGWGKPVWAVIGTLAGDDTRAVLMDNKEHDGIEAWVYLNHKDMPHFEQDEHIKVFTK